MSGLSGEQSGESNWSFSNIVVHGSGNTTRRQIDHFRPIYRKGNHHKIMSAVGYSIIFQDKHYDRKHNVTVIADDVLEAIEIAKSHAESNLKLVGVNEWRPRWVQSDASDVPTIISEPVLKRYAALLQLVCIPEAQASDK